MHPGIFERSHDRIVIYVVIAFDYEGLLRPNLGQEDAAWQAFLAEAKQEFTEAGLPDFPDKLDAFVKFAA